MYLFGHLGIGSRLVGPFTKKLPKKAVFLGTLLPDLIDKPLYYGLSFITGKHASELGWISGTRTFGHTSLFLILITVFAFAKRSQLLAAVSLGVSSHLLLDSIGDRFILHGYSTSSHLPLLWPLTGWNFPVTPYHGLAEHLSRWTQPAFFWGEIIGILLLLREYRKSRAKSWIRTPPPRNRRG